MERTSINFDELILEENPDAIIVTTIDGAVTHWNKGAENVFGYSNADAIGRLLIDIIVPPDRIEEEQQFLQKTLKNGMAHYGSLRKRRDGSLIFIDVTSKALRNAAGEIEHILYSKKDVTPLKVLRDAKLVDAKFRDLLESTPDGIIMTNATGRIVLANTQAERLFGYSSGELRGQLIEILLPQRMRGGHVGHRSGYVAQPHKRAMGSGMELYGLRKDGTEFPVEISLSPLQSEEDTLVMSAIRDVSERKQVEAEMRGLNAQLKQHMQELLSANQELESFCYSVSHDLRAPLRSMDGFSLALLEDYAEVLDDTGKDYLRRICTSSHQMAQLIDGLLKLSRITRSELHREQLNISAIARKTVQQLLRSDPGRDITLKIMDDMQGNGDPDLISIALGNLLGNAIKFSSKAPDPMVEISMQKDAGSTVFCVRDNGAGFDMAYSDKLFGAFQRLHAANEFEGTGIGLAIVQRVITRHGGKIWAEGQVGHGAAFFFTLETPS